MSRKEMMKLFTSTRECKGCKHLCLERIKRDEFPCLNPFREEDKKTMRCLSKAAHSLAC